MNNIIARFNELVPSALPFVEGKLEGHKERKNYSIVGPGVAEDSKQFIKIAKPHGFNLGAVSAMPKNGSGLHSHTTAEVFIIYSGSWRFYWGAEGKNQTILSEGDIISMPTNMFRGFENAGDKEGLIFVVLGEDDPGIITWVPEVLDKAKKTGMALLDDNSLIDLSKNKIPEGRKLLEPINQDQINKFENFNLDQIQPYISKIKNRLEFEKNIGEQLKLNQILGNKFEKENFNPLIEQHTGFNLTVLKGTKGKVENLSFEKSTILFSQKGNWEIIIDDKKYNLSAKDTLSVPVNSKVNISINNQEISFLNCVSKL